MMPLVGRAVLTAALAASAATLAAAQDAAPIPAAPLDGVDAEVAMQIREAEDAVAAALARGAGNAQRANAYGELARIYHHYELVDAAEAAYLNAVRLAPRDARWPHLLGYLYQQAGRLDEAARALLQARPHSDAPAVIDARLGEVYLGLDRLRDARERFEQVADVFPAFARHGLGEVALREERWQDAVRHFEFALARAPQATAIHYSLAMANRALGRLDAARRHLEQRGDGAIRIADPLVDALQMLARGERALVIQGRRAFGAGQFREAAALFRKATEARPASAVARANLGAALAQLGERAAAREQFEAAVRLDPGEGDARRGLGLLLLAEGRRSEAASHLRAAFQASPDDESLAVSLAVLLADLQQYRDALAVLEHVHQQPGDRTASTTTLARLLAASPDRSLRNGERALSLAMQVYQTAPSAAHAETVALALAELGRCAEASDWMRNAIATAGGEEAVRLRGELRNYDRVACRR